MGDALLKYQAELTVLHCANCAMPFAMPPRFENDRREDHAIFYCPLGHTNSFRDKTEAERLRVLLDDQRRIATQQAERALAAEVMLTKAKREASRIKKRINAGLCTCCNRTFANLAKHMATKHKEAQ